MHKPAQTIRVPVTVWATMNETEYRAALPREKTTLPRRLWFLLRCALHLVARLVAGVTRNERRTEWLQ